MYLEKQDQERKKKLEKQIKDLESPDSGSQDSESPDSGSPPSPPPPPPPIPIDCVMEEWEDWDECSVPCGGGTQYRNRDIVTQPAHGGEPCGVEEESQACNSQICDVDCVVGLNGIPNKWSDWSTCSKPCNTGTQTRTREILTYPEGNGARCGDLSELKTCNTHECAQDCQLSTTWENKGLDCDTWNYWEYKGVIQPKKGNGKNCPCQWRAQRYGPHYAASCQDLNIPNHLKC